MQVLLLKLLLCSCHIPLAFCRSVIVGFCARGSLILLEPPAARADSPDAGALWLCTRRLSNVEVIVEEATDLSLVGDWRFDPTLRVLSSRDCCCCQGGKIDEKVVVVVGSCVTDDVFTTGCKSWNKTGYRADVSWMMQLSGYESCFVFRRFRLCIPVWRPAIMMKDSLVFSNLVWQNPRMVPWHRPWLLP